MTHRTADLWDSSRKRPGCESDWIHFQAISGRNHVLLPTTPFSNSRPRRNTGEKNDVQESSDREREQGLGRCQAAVAAGIIAENRGFDYARDQ